MQTRADVQKSENGNFAFAVSDIHFGYQRKTGDVLNGASFSAKYGDVVGLVGTNGSGKTTAGKIMTGLLKPSCGKILFNGRSIKQRELLKKTMFVMQEAEFQFFTNSVMNELLYGNKDSPDFRAEAERLLKKFDMWECRNRHPFSLSGGQMQKLSLMIAYLSPKQIVILDEPTAGLDALSLQSCAELIRDMQKKKLIIVITHDIELISKVCTRCICIAGGSVDREMIMENDSCLKELTAYMEKNFSMAEHTGERQTASGACPLHPYTKLLYWLITMLAVSTADNAIVFSVYAALIFMLLADGWYAMALAGGGIVALLFGLNRVFSHTAVSFLLVFLPRVLAVGLSMWALIGRDEATRTIAALRGIHVPEKLIMVCSVIFRFFPVLSGDMKLMRQSVKTRGAFVTFGQKLRAFPEYMEILTVPMALRVIRIADTLSASAETRGIDLKRKRYSYVSLKFGAWDICFLVLLAAVTAVGIMI